MFDGWGLAVAVGGAAVGGTGVIVGGMEVAVAVGSGGGVPVGGMTADSVGDSDVVGTGVAVGAVVLVGRGVGGRVVGVGLAAAANQADIWGLVASSAWASVTR
ncbi:MAG: hypothetical protein PVI09_17745, partial [Anaerolineae bacterium]